jgi:hypothetical protein
MFARHHVAFFFDYFTAALAARRFVADFFDAAA